jgi:hypothetical protein
MTELEPTSAGWLTPDSRCPIEDTINFRLPRSQNAAMAAACMVAGVSLLPLTG